MAAKRSRAERRSADRELQKQLDRRDKLAALGPGGAPARPMTVESASLVEPVARSTPCARCEGAVRVEDHAVRVVEGRSLRVATVACPVCGARRELYFVIAPRLPN